MLLWGESPHPPGSPLAAWCACPWPSRDPKTGSERLWGEDEAVAGHVARGRVNAAVFVTAGCSMGTCCHLLSWTGENPPPIAPRHLSACTIHILEGVPVKAEGIASS